MAHTDLNSLFTDIANAIRTRTGGTNKLTADNFPDEIKKILVPSGNISITSNGSKDVKNYATANVNVVPSVSVDILVNRQYSLSNCGSYTYTVTADNASAYKLFVVACNGGDNDNSYGINSISCSSGTLLAETFGKGYHNNHGAGSGSCRLQIWTNVASGAKFSINSSYWGGTGIMGVKVS